LRSRRALNGVSIDTVDDSDVVIGTVVDDDVVLIVPDVPVEPESQKTSATTAMNLQTLVLSSLLLSERKWCYLWSYLRTGRVVLLIFVAIVLIEATNDFVRRCYRC
jgi:hypothetical protein